MHVLINGLSIGSGGGYTVGRMLFEFLAIHRPGWRVSLVVTEGNRLHEEFRGGELPDNGRILWAPPNTTGLLARGKYERGEMIDFVGRESVDVVLQLNGMVVGGMPVPTFCHFQDPFPYRPEAWTRRRDPLWMWMKRRSHARALRTCAAAGWTSEYLRDLITGRLGVKPKRSVVLYNGVPDDWSGRTAADVVPWRERPMRLVTISNVGVYKRQELVIRALPRVVADPALAELHYHIAGACDPAYKAHLESLAAQLGVGDRVHVEGRVSDERAAELFATSRAFVLMSVCESFGIPAIEAMSFGTPVVTSDCCAMPEVCGDAAELVPVDDERALAAKIVDVLGNAERAEQLRSAGFENIHRFRWGAIAERLAQELEAISG